MMESHDKREERREEREAEREERNGEGEMAEQGIEGWWALIGHCAKFKKFVDKVRPRVSLELV